MKLKSGFILREVCGQKVIVAEGLEAVDFGHLISLNDSICSCWMYFDVLGAKITKVFTYFLQIKNIPLPLTRKKNITNTSDNKDMILYHRNIIKYYIGGG